MNNRLIKFLLLSLLAAASLAARPLPAARLTTLFAAETEVNARDAGERQAALQTALSEVLLRLVGDATLLQEPAVQELLAKPQTYVELFRYRELEPAEAGAPKSLRLRVRFDGVALARALRERGLPYWGPERPDVLVWLAIDDRGERYLLSEQSQQPAGEWLGRAAERRGLPLLLPLLDLDDRRQIQFADVWGGFLGPVEQASRRYRPQVVLVGRLHHAAEQAPWRARWTLIQSDAQESWEAQPESLEQAIDAGVDGAARLLARRYALQSGDSGGDSRRLSVSGVASLAAYARVQRYLASLSVVDRVEVMQVQGEEVTFDVRLNGEERQFLQLIALGRVLEPLDRSTPWRFRLRP